MAFRLLLSHEIKKISKLNCSHTLFFSCLLCLQLQNFSLFCFVFLCFCVYVLLYWVKFTHIIVCVFEKQIHFSLRICFKLLLFLLSYWVSYLVRWSHLKAFCFVIVFVTILYIKMHMSVPVCVCVLGFL